MSDNLELETTSSTEPEKSSASLADGKVFVRTDLTERRG